jgi:hypothetical protein
MKFLPTIISALPGTLVFCIWFFGLLNPNVRIPSSLDEAHVTVYVDEFKGSIYADVFYITATVVLIFLTGPIYKKLSS